MSPDSCKNLPQEWGTGPLTLLSKGLLKIIWTGSREARAGVRVSQAKPAFAARSPPPGSGEKGNRESKSRVEGCRTASRLLCKQKVPNFFSLIPFPKFPFSQEMAASGRRKQKCPSPCMIPQAQGVFGCDNRHCLGPGRPGRFLPGLAQIASCH